MSAVADLLGGILLLVGTIAAGVWASAAQDAYARPRAAWAQAGVSRSLWWNVTLAPVAGFALAVVAWIGWSLANFDGRPWPAYVVAGVLIVVGFVAAPFYLLLAKRRMAKVQQESRAHRPLIDPAVLAKTEGRPGVAKPDPILVVDGLERRFGGIKAVDVEHLEIQRGLITGLIGPNGAGKTTLFNLLTGFDVPDGGTWQFNGVDMGGSVAHLMSTQGMVRTFQLTKALSKMTVLDNMMLGGIEQRGERFSTAFVPAVWRHDENLLRERAETLLERFGMAHMTHEYAGTLSGGQRKLLEMARALMTEPALVMLDEPMAGVNPALTQSLLGHVKSLRDEGMSVIFVEHDMDVVRDISDWVVVMAEGSIIAEGTHDDVTGNSEVIDAYLGTDHGEAATEDPTVHAHQQASTIVAEREEAVEGGPEGGSGVSGDTCPACGAGLRPGARFCPACGHVLARAEKGTSDG